MKSELAIKRDEWFESNEGQKCVDEGTLITSLQFGDQHSTYLRDRLERAFLAGAQANEEVKDEIVSDVIGKPEPKQPEIMVGQCWYGRVQHTVQIEEVKIHGVTELTVMVHRRGMNDFRRYLIEDYEFIEMTQDQDSGL